MSVSGAADFVSSLSAVDLQRVLPQEALSRVVQNGTRLDSRSLLEFRPTSVKHNYISTCDGTNW